MGKGNPALKEWAYSAPAYQQIIHGKRADSQFIREQLLYPTLLRMVHKSQGTKVLDLGCGDGSVGQLLSDYDVFYCDLVNQRVPQQDRQSIQDAQALGFADNAFDIVLASLVLMWISTLEQACREINRVTREGGNVVVALMSPYFYRTGKIDQMGGFVLQRDLSQQFVLADLRIADIAGPVTYYYRPLHECLNVLILAGLQIMEVTETFLDMNEYLSSVPLSQRVRPRTGHVPMYSFIRCQKKAPR